MAIAGAPSPRMSSANARRAANSDMHEIIMIEWRALAR
jgi:hypothetical protein